MGHNKWGGYSSPSFGKEGGVSSLQNVYLETFSRHKDQEVLGYPLIWLAVNRDETILKEIESKDEKILERRSFYDIQQNNVRVFGIYGNGYNFYFDKANGNLYINNTMYSVSYQVDGLEFNLSDNINHKDLIAYKEGHTNRDEDRVEQEVILDGVSVGYKTKYRMIDNWVDVQFIMNASLSGASSLEVKITSEKDLDGKLSFKRENVTVEEFEAPIQAHHSGIMNWEIKE